MGKRGGFVAKVGRTGQRTPPVRIRMPNKPAERLRSNLEKDSRRLLDLILTQPPKEFIAYVWSRFLVDGAGQLKGGKQPAPDRDLLSSVQFIMEYAHAAWSTSSSAPTGELSEKTCGEIFKLGDELRNRAVIRAMQISGPLREGVFGPQTADLSFHAISDWILMRGNRYQVLEQEFFDYVLMPHDEALKRNYGAGASEVSAGIQRIADTMRSGHADAAELISGQRRAVLAIMADQRVSMEDALRIHAERSPEDVGRMKQAMLDVFFGGLCNVSAHAGLPNTLLQDLGYERGGNVDFVAEGPLACTPLRSLPVRTKPLINLDGDYFAPDPTFVRDGAYRAIQWNLVQRDQAYKEEFNAKQKALTEAAFADILKVQLKGAICYESVYYRDVTTNQWVENDALVLLDDALLLIEAKAGAPASVASPVTDFDRHVRAVTDLITKAYSQAKRFFDYLYSAPVVPIFQRRGDAYVEIAKIRASDYRVAIPIGLTVEAFTPYSTISKEWPGIDLIAGKHAYFTLSIDDLMVLKRFLPTGGSLLHYFEVRQQLAAMKGVFIYDEIDHLGAYVSHNRFDLTISAQRKLGTTVFTTGYGDRIDAYFSTEDWFKEPPPLQTFPPHVLELLSALQETSEPGWLRVDSLIRNFGDAGREYLSSGLTTGIGRLTGDASFHFQLSGDEPLLVWMQRLGTAIDDKGLERAAAIAGLSHDVTAIAAIILHCDVDGRLRRAVAKRLDMPTRGSALPEDLEVEIERTRAKIAKASGETAAQA